MDRTPTHVPPSTTVRRPPACISVSELKALVAANSAPPLIDVRAPGQFHPRHIRGAQNFPENQTTALTKKVQSLEKAVLICEDGSQSLQVAKALICCKITTACYLEGGLAAWAAAGGKLAETTRTGYEHDLPPPPKETPPEPKKSGPSTWIRSLKDSLFGSEDSD